MSQLCHKITTNTRADHTDIWPQSVNLCDFINVSLELKRCGRENDALINECKIVTKKLFQLGDSVILVCAVYL